VPIPPEQLLAQETSLLEKGAKLSRTWGRFPSFATTIVLAGLVSIEVARTDKVAIAIASVLAIALVLGFLSTLRERPSDCPTN
jgi:hypothetical protein